MRACLCVCVCVGRYSIFSFPRIKGAINFPLLLIPECNTHAGTAERLGPDLANTQDELIYQTAAWTPGPDLQWLPENKR